MDFGQIKFGIYPQGLNIMLNSRTKRKNESSDCTLAVKVLLFKADNFFSIYRHLTINAINQHFWFAKVQITIKSTNCLKVFAV